MVLGDFFDGNDAQGSFDVLLAKTTGDQILPRGLADGPQDPPRDGSARRALSIEGESPGGSDPGRTPKSRKQAENQEGASTGYPRFVSFEQLASGFKEEILPALEKRIAKGSTLKSDGAGAFKQAQTKGYPVEQVPFKTEPDRAKEHLKGIHWLNTNLKLRLASTYHGCWP